LRQWWIPVDKSLPKRLILLDAHAIVDGKGVPLEMTPEMRSTHLYVCGSTGVTIIFSRTAHSLPNCLLNARKSIIESTEVAV
jgi:hypothetical protein